MPDNNWPPAWYYHFPPTWMKDDVKEVLRYVAPGQLYARVGSEACHLVWVYFDDGQPAEPIGDDEDSAAGILIERGYLIEAEKVTLSRDCGENFTAARLVFTASGSQLHEQLAKEE